MALLSADDVLNKAFSKTKYREGFDQDEVDDFLDEVAHTISSLIAERDDFAARLQQAQAGGGGVEAAPLTEAGGIPGTSGLLGAATDPNPPSPAGMLAMAQKLHDEYVHAGEEEKDRIVDEAKTKAESIVMQAQQDAKARMDDLAGERSELERKIDDLRRFERDYRARLKTFLENLLGDLDHGTARESAAAVVDQPFDAPVVTAAPAIEWPDGSAADDDVLADEPTPDEADGTPVFAAPAEGAFVPEVAHELQQEPEPAYEAAEVDANDPPVRQSFGYQAPADSGEDERAGNVDHFASPFAPVTQQNPIVSGDADNQEPPRYPNAF